jgi:hypothetical protein
VSENRYQHPESGAELRRQDVDSISDNAGFADDRTLWEMLRLTTGSATPDRAILPYGKRGWAKESGFDSTAMIHGNTADGSVRVMPFRAIIGSIETSDMLGKLRDMRSGYLVGASTQKTVVPLSPNSSGNPRWDLVYVTVALEANGDSADYIKKDPATKAITEENGVISKKATVTVDVVTGTPGASPARPALPADAGGSYTIALAYVWVPDAFGVSSAVVRSRIHEVAPCYPIHSATGAASMAPANQQHEVGGTVYTNQGTATDQSVQPGAYLPPTMVGKESIQILVQLGFAPTSHVDGDVVDDSRDWRFRYFKWIAALQASTTNATALASDRNFTPSAPTGSAAFSSVASGVGQSYRDDNASLIVVADGTGAALVLNATNAAGIMTGTNKVVIYVRNTDGALVFKRTGSDGFNGVIWLDASGVYSNFGTV